MTLIIIVFVAVYLGMLFGSFPGLALDRTGMALLGAIVLAVFIGFSEREWIEAVDWSALAMLFGLMIVSGQFYFSGLYARLVKEIGLRKMGPEGFLLTVILFGGGLSALLINDIVCLALVLPIVQLSREKGWNPLPHLLGLAAASNVGSAMTLIGNPQNILISEVMNLSFSGYFLRVFPICLAGLFWCYFVIRRSVKGKWKKAVRVEQVEEMQFDRWQAIKGLLVLAGVVSLFFFSGLPKYQVVLVAAGILLLSRKMASQKMLGFVDWQFFILFIGLFLVKAALFKTEVPGIVVDWMTERGVDLSKPATLFGFSFVFSNVFSNVPAVMLLLPFAEGSFAGTVLALSSTLAGNLIITGSLANIIVVQKARDVGVRVGFADHAKIGVPITLGTVALAIGWLFWFS